MKKKISPWTKLIEPQDQDPAFKSLTDAVTRASTIVFENAQSFRQRDWRDQKSYSYGLQATPIVRRLEQQIAHLDGVDYCLLYPSGLNAISMLLYSLLESGDHILIGNNVYGPTREICDLFAKKMHISVSTYDSTCLSNLNLTSKTKLIWVESPGSITMEVTDIKKLASIAQKHKIKLVCDATWSAQVAFSPYKNGADLVVYALTKYHSGGSDVLMGSITMKHQCDYEKMQQTRKAFGIGVSPDDCSVVLRSLPHLQLRYLSQDQSTRKVAQWLSIQPQISKVLHPAFQSCPGHQYWLKDFYAAASIFSVEFKTRFTEENIDSFIDSLQLFKIGVSWGGPVSLALPFNPKQLHQDSQVKGAVVRFYIGLEDTKDLIQDIKEALHSLP